MPKGFKWVSVDITNEDQLQEVYTLLTENYVEDDDNMFRCVSPVSRVVTPLLHDVLFISDLITPKNSFVGHLCLLDTL